MKGVALVATPWARFARVLLVVNAAQTP